MSPDPAPSASPAALQRDAARLALRIGFAAAVGLVLAEVWGVALPFLAPMFAVQLLVGLKRPPTLAQGIGIVVVIALATWVAALITALTVGHPLGFILVICLVFFFCFLLDARGIAGPVPSLLLIFSAAMPLFAIHSPALAQGVVQLFTTTAIVAVLLSWIAHAAFPAIVEPAVQPRPAGITGGEVRAALVNVAILTSLLVVFLIQGDQLSVVLLITVITVLRQPLAEGYRAALGLLLGNIVGGVASLVVYQFAMMVPSPVFLLLLVLIVGLILGGRIATAGPMAPIYVVALTSFLILLGIGLTSSESGSGDAFVDRFVKVTLAVAYALGAISLLRPAQHQRARQPVQA